MIKENIIESLDELLLLKSKWELLTKNNDDLTPFQSPSWIITWWYKFGKGKLFVYSVENQNELLFLAPCYIRELESERQKKLVFIGTGNTDYQNCVYTNNSQEYFQKFTKILTSNKEKWDLIDLSDIHPSSLLLKVFQFERHEIIPVINLNNSYNEYIRSTFSKKKISDIKRLENALRREGSMIFELCNASNLHEFFEELLVLNYKRWHLKEQGGILNNENERSFLSETARLLYKEDYLRFFRIKSNKIPLAVTLAVFKKDTLYSYLTAFDPDFQKYSPGLILNLKIIEWCFTNRIKRFNFLKGAENYKFTMGAETTSNFRVFQRTNFSE